MRKSERRAPKSFSYELEKSYYSQRWPQRALPYEHLESYVRCWLEPDGVFTGKRVLDIGAGECTYTRLIADRFGPKEVVACELFRERMLPAARANRNLSLKFTSGDCLWLPFRSGSFDVVFGTFILHQLPDLQQVISEIRRVCLQGGFYIGIEPNPYNPVHLYRYLRGNHSLNQYLFGSKHLIAFEQAGFEVKIFYFYVKLPWLRSRFLGTCMGIIAERREV